MEELENLALELLDFTEGFYPTPKQCEVFFYEHPPLSADAKEVVMNNVKLFLEV